MTGRRNAIRIHPRDNVAVCVEAVGAGDVVRVDDAEIAAREAIPIRHKMALSAIGEGGAVIKYGFPIGHATRPVEPGMWVHTHNVRTTLSGLIEYEFRGEVPRVIPADDGTTFDGFLRPDGEVGIRNEIWIVPTVGCVNEIARALAREMEGEGLPGTVDGIFAWTHPHGCSQLAEDHEMTRKILAGLVRHPNAAGVLVLSLGCEDNTPASFRDLLRDADPDRVRFLICQDVEDERAAGMALLRELCARAGRFARRPIPVNRLRVGLKCGGSDGFSGITANPLLGAFSDMLISRGGTTVLTEVPEMFGAETILMDRCVDRRVFERCVAMIDDFKRYFIRYGQPIYENPSPGNIDAGLTTLEDKSLGCVQKGGTSPVMDVLDYGDRLRTPGLNLLAGPGNDMVAATVLSASGVHLILFTTGLGTPLGSPVPTVKIATHGALAARKAAWIDFDAGGLLEGASLRALADRFFPFVLDVASGRRRTRNEESGFREIAIFKDGVTV